MNRIKVNEAIYLEQQGSHREWNQSQGGQLYLEQQGSHRESNQSQGGHISRATGLPPWIKSKSRRPYISSNRAPTVNRDQAYQKPLLYTSPYANIWVRSLTKIFCYLKRPNISCYSSGNSGMNINVWYAGLTLVVIFV